MKNENSRLLFSRGDVSKLLLSLCDSPVKILDAPGEGKAIVAREGKDGLNFDIVEVRS